MAGIDNNTLLYLRGDSFTDLSQEPKTVINNNATISENGKFNKAFNISEGYLTLNENLIHSTNDFTIDLWFKKAISAEGNLFRFNATNNASSVCSVGIGIKSDSFATLVAYNSTSWASSSNISYSFALDTWYHFACVRTSTDIAFYVNGKKIHTFNVGSNALLQNNLCVIGKDSPSGIGSTLNGYICNFRVSNIARYTTDFTPPTQPYNSLSINVTNPTSTQVDFNVTKLGQETINKVEVLVNNVVSQSYTSNYDNLTYLIDKSLLGLGDNKIKIRVEFDDVYFEEKELILNYTIDELPSNSSLKQLIETVELIANTDTKEYNQLATILKSKDVEVDTSTDKMSNLIDKVSLLGAYEDPVLWLYKDGDECVDVAGGWKSITTISGTGASAGVVTKTPSSILLDSYYGSGSNRMNCISNVNSIILNSKYSILKVKISVYNFYSESLSSFYVVLDKKCNYMQNEDVIASVKHSGGNGDYIISIPISNITSPLYIKMRTERNYTISNIFKVDIKQVWLEK